MELTMNPAPGSYIAPLVSGLKSIDEAELAEAVDKGQLKLAIYASITGSVKIARELKDTFVRALAAHAADHLDQQELCEHYALRLEEGKVVPAYTAGALVFRGDTPAFLSEGKTFAPVELFLKS
jgi:uncharacterized protein YciW